MHMHVCKPAVTNHPGTQVHIQWHSMCPSQAQPQAQRTKCTSKNTMSHTTHVTLNPSASSDAAQHPHPQVLTLRLGLAAAAAAGETPQTCGLGSDTNQTGPIPWLSSPHTLAAQ